MPSDLKSVQIKILTYGIYALMTILTSITAWHAVILYSMPNDYVRLERYKEDLVDNRSSLCRIENKLDQIIMRHN